MLVALAVMVPLIVNEFDLSVGSVAALSSVVVAAGTTRFDLRWVLAVLVAVLVSATIGLFNGPSWPGAGSARWSPRSAPPA